MKTATFSSMARPLPLAIIAMTALLGCKSISLVHAATALLDASGARSQEGRSSGTPTVAKPADVAPPPALPAGLPAALLPSPAAGAQRAPLDTAAPQKNGESPTAPMDKELAVELARQRNAMGAHSEGSTARLDLLETTQAKLQQQLTALDDQQKILGTAERKHSEQDASTWTNLAKMYEVMPPKNAAIIFDVIDPHVLLKILERMDVRKAAAVMAAMGPDRARLATQMLAAQKAPVTSAGVVKTALPPASSEAE